MSSASRSIRARVSLSRDLCLTCPLAILSPRDFKGGAIRIHLHRMRKRFVRLVEEEISQFVSDPAAHREEVVYLVDLISK